MVTAAAARRMALALPEATEQDHHGMNSFRVQGKIFATVADRERVHRTMLATASELSAPPGIMRATLSWGTRSPTWRKQA